MKKYTFTVYASDNLLEEQRVIVIAKNIQSAVAHLSQGGFYTEEDIESVHIARNS